MLDAHVDLIDTHSVRLDDKGFKAVVHDPNSFPLTVHKGIQIQPGRETLVAISAIDIKSDKGVRQIPPIKRGCNFPEDEEANLELYQKYSQVAHSQIDNSSLLSC